MRVLRGASGSFETLEKCHAQMPRWKEAVCQAQTSRWPSEGFEGGKRREAVPRPDGKVERSPDVKVAQ